MTSIEIRVLGPTGIEDYHAHLLRLDPGGRARCANSTDDHSIEGHCLRLLAGQPILVGGYVDNVLRASLEIVPDRTAQHADALFTAEASYASAALTQMLLSRLLDEARRYRLADVKLRGIDDAALVEQMAVTNQIAVVPGSPISLKFPAVDLASAPMAQAPAVAVSHA